MSEIHLHACLSLHLLISLVAVKLRQEEAYACEDITYLSVCEVDPL
jgi:hypothetical protein